MTPSRPTIVLGAGGHGRVLIDALRRAGVEILGCTNRTGTAPPNLPAEVAFLGDDEAVLSQAPDQVLLVNGLGSVEVNTRRKDLFARLKARGYAFATVVHPSATIARDVLLGEGTQVMAGAVLQTGCRVGDNTIVNTRASLDHDCCIGAHVHIAPGATLSGAVSVGELAHIGLGANIVQGLSIGAASLVAAGATVIAAVPDEARVAGVPARRLPPVAAD